MSPNDRVAQLYPQALGSIFPAFWDSQSYGGNIQTRLIWGIYIKTHNVAYLLKLRALEPENQPLLVNGSEIIFASKQRLDKHVLAATDKHETRE
jgi:hypothetical protein